MITEQARIVASEAGIPRTQFKASRAWASKFMKRAGFSLRGVGGSACAKSFLLHTRRKCSPSIVTSSTPRLPAVLDRPNRRSGTKLPPYLVFKRKTMPLETFPKGVVVRVNKKGYMTDDTVVECYCFVWLLRRGASLKDHIPNLLVLDSFRIHLTAKVKAELRKEHTDMLVIPGGLTGQLQPRRRCQQAF